MKIDSWVWVALKATTAIAIIATAAFLIKRFVDQTEDSNQQEIDNWIDERLAETFSKKLNQPVQQVLVALRHPNASQLSSEIQQIVESIELLFSKESSSQIMMKLSILYKDGSSFSTSINKTWDSLPGVVRRDFLQTGSQCVCIPWEFSAIKVS